MDCHKTAGYIRLTAAFILMTVLVTGCGSTGGRHTDNKNNIETVIEQQMAAAMLTQQWFSLRKP